MFKPSNDQGGWKPKDPVTSKQLNSLDQQLVLAVDGVGGGKYDGPLVFGDALLQQLRTTVIAKDDLADGDTFACNVALGSVFHLSVDAGEPGPVDITLFFANVRAGGIFAVALGHLVDVSLAWTGPPGLLHRFAGGVFLDGQPTPGEATDLWLGVAMTDTQILWTITRDIGVSGP